MLLYSTLNFKTKIHSNYLNDNVYNLLDKTFTIPSSYSYNVFEVTKEYIARPDLIALDAYGDDMFGDIICKLNGISNPFELNEGMKLIIPSPENIMDFAKKPKHDDIESNLNMMGTGDVIEKPIAKQKNSKRQANEAIVGDTRFKIDSATGVIIY